MPVLRHPNLPGRTIDVNVKAARAHRRAGWVDVDDVPTDDDNKPAWVAYAQAAGHDVDGLTKQQIIDLVGDNSDDSTDISDEED